MEIGRTIRVFTAEPVVGPVPPEQEHPDESRPEPELREQPWTGESSPVPAR